MGRKKHVGELYRAPFPLYSVCVHGETGLVITAGGGGASKTGIKNGVHFLSLELVGNQHVATLLHCHDTDIRATMNMSLGGDVMAAGQDDTCVLMRYKQMNPKERRTKAQKAKGSGEENCSQRRNVARRPSGKSDGTEMKDETAYIKVEQLGEICTDFSPSDALQKCVRFNIDLSLLFTGGADGHIRVWEFPSLKKKLDFKAHNGEVEDLDISPGNKVVTVGRDLACCIWSDGQLAMKLQWHDNLPHITEGKYRYQACRFAKVEDNPSLLRLYTVQIPHKRDRKPPPCYITKWEGHSFIPLHTKPCGNEVISCLAVSDSGTFLGLGTVTGSVGIYIAFSLQKLYHVHEAHGIVVTDLAFVPSQQRGILGNNEVALLSVAVDSRCKLHLIPNRSSFPLWLVLLLCALLVVGSIILLQMHFPTLI